jgi:hypothetical protein
MKKETFTFTKVLTLAFVAQRFNKSYNKHTTSSMTANDTIKYSVANKQIMRFLTGNEQGMELGVINHLRKNEKKLRITEADEKNTSEAVEWLESLAMGVLSGEINGFDSSIYMTFEKGELQHFDFGLVAYMPQTYIRNVKKENLELRITQRCEDSDYVSKPGHKVNLNIELQTGVYSSNYSSFIYVAITDNDELVTFWSQKDFLDAVGKTINITAKIKKQMGSRWYQGINETQLNYVKLVEESK